MKPEMVEAIKAYVEENKKAMVEDVMALCRIPSEREEASPGAPYGRPCAAAVAAAAKLAGRLGLVVEQNEEHGYAVARLPKGEKTIGFFTHCDVVPAGDGWTHTEPYEPIVKDGMLIGRGVTDNKCAVVAGLYVMRAVHQLKLPVACSLLTFMGSDEESDMRDITAFAAAHPPLDLALVPDSDFPVCIGEKGLLEVSARAVNRFRQIREITGGTKSNVIIGDCEAKVEIRGGLYEELEKLTAGKAGYSLDRVGELAVLKAQGRSGHAARPEGTLNAAKMIVQVLAACESLEPNDREIMATAALALSDDYAEAMGFAMADEHSGKMTVACGLARTNHGIFCLSFNPRYPVTAKAGPILEGFAAFFGPRGWEICDISDDPGYYNPPGSEVVETLLSVYRQATGDTERPPYVMGGATYGRKLQNAVVFGPRTPWKETPVPFEAGHGRGHQPDEAIAVDTLLSAVEVYIRAVVEMDGVLNKKDA